METIPEDTLQVYAQVLHSTPWEMLSLAEQLHIYRLLLDVAEVVYGKQPYATLQVTTTRDHNGCM